VYTRQQSGVMPGSHWQTKSLPCDHCGTVERALGKWSQEIHDTCECLCHAYRMGKLTTVDKAWRKKKPKRKGKE
jgi:hypothetical protein